jgi:hypothetical protein
MKKTVKVIFLDIDGVLSPHVKVENKGQGDFPYDVKFNPRTIKNLKVLLKESNARIVLSTTWIKNIGFKATTLALATHGIVGPYFVAEDVGEKSNEITVRDWIMEPSSSKFYGTAVTPKKFTSEKCHEISFWLSEYKDKISGYVVLDDEFIYDQEEHQVRVNGKKGLTVDDVKKALMILNQGISLNKK